MYSYSLCFQSYTCCPLGGALVLWCQRSFIAPHIFCWLHGYTLLQQLTAGRKKGGAGNGSNGCLWSSSRHSRWIKCAIRQDLHFLLLSLSSWWSHRTGWREIENGCVVWFCNVTHFHFLSGSQYGIPIEMENWALVHSSAWPGRHYEDFSKAVLLGNTFLG